MFHKFQGIVLRARDYGESNQLVVLFTSTIGKITIVARGSKKTRSRFGAVTEPFTEATFVCYGKNGMPTLSQADQIESHQRIRSDLFLSTYGSYWFEMLDKLTEEREPAPEMYLFLVNALRKLEEGTDPDVLTRIVELRMMEAAGYKPILDRCVCCRIADRFTYFSVRQGGVLCEACRAGDPQSSRLSENVARILFILQHIDLDRLGNINVKIETKRQLEQMLDAFMGEYIHVELKAKKILKKICALEE